MKILDDIIATTKNSDLQSDYDQMNANLMQKPTVGGMAQEFKTLNKKRIAKASFIPSTQNSVKTTNKFDTLSTDDNVEVEEPVQITFGLSLWCHNIELMFESNPWLMFEPPPRIQREETLFHLSNVPIPDLVLPTHQIFN
ncbi:hypothetical protein CEXT_602061 [Caerostris extrusa]|uniref:Uncharacterized protein n=1 Tax=Caerostris extrusa TaxID=172846 RepID=A0AAV4PZ96_CAEEX|nr:hypothetical protein CEXT_602061 [Caerostris extrusa]